MEALLEAMQNHVHGGNTLTGCEAELQELMRQIDIMVANKKSEWETQLQAVENTLDVRERELTATQALLDQKCKEMGILQHQLLKMEKVQQGMVVQYESQLKNFQEELGELMKSYKKLQKRQLKEEREEIKSREGNKESKSELTRLNKKIEEFRQKSLDWDKQRLQYHQQVASLEEQRKLLLEQCKVVQTLTQENKELNTMLRSQEDIIQNAEHQQQQLHKELARTNELLNAMEIAARKSLEESLLLHQSSDVTHSQTELQRVQVQLQASLKGEEILKAEVTHLQKSLESSNAQCIRLTEEITRRHDEMRQIEEDHRKCKQDIKKLRDQLNHGEQSRRSEMEGMKAEVSQLTTELHQRDITIATISTTTSNMERQLRSEMEKAERSATGYNVKSDASFTDLHDSYSVSLRSLEQENQQLQQELSEMKTKLEASAKASQDRYEMVLQQIQNKLTDIRQTEDRRMQDLQHKHEEQLQKLQTRLEETIKHYETCKHNSKQQHALPKPGSPSYLPDGPIQSNSYDCSPHGSPHRAISPSSRISLTADGNEADFSDDTSVKSAHSVHRELFAPLSPSVMSPTTSVAAQFLQEEEKRSQKLLKRLDRHIEDLKNESESTVIRYLQSSASTQQFSASN
ncbi:centrosomal protein of 63 kDa isoform X5 [Callorhinchus milii]|uniref:Centrosomal protein of 63 kDa-like protein n=1 Tax=Callorhinchus milii TaxID=7868 RepID=V9KLF0_CALMI|nr:centrosomal protein of 63 kDa isoform X5 [Callorhinchus milii]